MGDERPCPPVNEDIVTPRYLFILGLLVKVDSMEVRVCLVLLGVALFKYFIKTQMITSTPSKPRATPFGKFH